MGILRGLVREQQRRRAGISDEVIVLHWSDFDQDRPSQAIGLQQGVDESHEQFISRVETAARAEGLRVVFMDNIRSDALA